jgi:hypothetical protein
VAAEMATGTGRPSKSRKVMVFLKDVSPYMPTALFVENGLTTITKNILPESLE